MDPQPPATAVNHPTGRDEVREQRLARRRERERNLRVSESDEVWELATSGGRRENTQQ